MLKLESNNGHRSRSFIFCVENCMTSCDNNVFWPHIGIIYVAIDSIKFCVVSTSGHQLQWCEILFTCIVRHRKYKTLRFNEVLFHSSFIPNFINRTAIGCNEIVVTITREIHPSGESTVSRQKCSSYSEPLFQFIPMQSTKFAEDKKKQVKIIHALA